MFPQFSSPLVPFRLFVTATSFLIFSAVVGFPVDSSFTLESAYEKAVKQYPFIRPVKPVVPTGVSVTQDLVYAAYGEREMHLDLYRLDSAVKQPKPLILFIHGGGWRSGNKRLEAPMAIYFARKGYVTATVEYRLSPEALFPAGVEDIKTAIRWLRAHCDSYGIEADKFFISGTSAGGQLATLVGATNRTLKFVNPEIYPEVSSDVQGVVDVDGILAFIHPESGEGNDRPGKTSAATYWFGGNQHEKDNLWKQASALTRVNENMPAALFVNSQHLRFHAGRDDFIKVLDRHGIYSEVHSFPETPHTFWMFFPWFQPTVQIMEVFLAKIQTDEAMLGK